MRRVFPWLRPTCEPCIDAAEVLAVAAAARRRPRALPRRRARDRARRDRDRAPRRRAPAERAQRLAEGLTDGQGLRRWGREAILTTSEKEGRGCTKECALQPKFTCVLSKIARDNAGMQLILSYSIPVVDCLNIAIMHCAVPVNSGCAGCSFAPCCGRSRRVLGAYSSI